jgi:hypothetical protein
MLLRNTFMSKAMTQQKYGERSNGITKTWFIERIWRLAEVLPVEEIAIAEIQGPDQVTWFSETQLPTCRAIAEHCKPINNADLSYPVILTEDYRVFDGMHRIARCIMLDKTHILAKRFPSNPEPDQTVTDSIS